MLIPSTYCLINGSETDAVPAALYRAKSNAAARLLTQSDWLIRDKRDGRYLACMRDGDIIPLRRSEDHNKTALWHDLQIAQQYSGLDRPISDVLEILQILQIDPSQYSKVSGLDVIAEPYTLEFAGKDRYARPLWLNVQTKSAWLRMKQAATKDNIYLQSISGYRSHQYQLGIFQRKMARGQSINEILKVNAAPGFSEHHSGRAIDISIASEPAAEESFENTTAFAWLMRNASDFGFRLSFPRGNPNGISYEPWHWCWQA